MAYFKDIYINNLEESTERTADGSSGIIIEIRAGGLLAYFAWWRATSNDEKIFLKQIPSKQAFTFIPLISRSNSRSSIFRQRCLYVYRAFSSLQYYRSCWRLNWCGAQRHMLCGLRLMVSNRPAKMELSKEIFSLSFLFPPNPPPKAQSRFVTPSGTPCI